MKNYLGYIGFFLLGIIQLFGQSESETKMVGRWAAGPPYAFTVENNIVFTASGGILQTLDISDPSNPKLLGQVATSGVINDISKDGNYVYLAEGDSGLKVIDVSNLANPTQVSELLLPGPVNKLIVNNQTLYVAEGRWDGGQWIGGLRTLDVSDPFNPQPLGFYVSPGESNFISLVDDYIYMNKKSVETLFIDISDLNNPTLAGSLNTRFGNAYLSGYLLFIGMKIFDVSNPLNPILLGEAVFQGGAEDVTVSGNFAFITIRKFWDGNNWRDGQIRIFDISDPVNPTEIGFYESSGDVANISYANYTLIISEGVYPNVSTSEEGSGLRIMDVTNPALPEPIGFFETPGVSMDVVVRDHYAFVLTLYGGISVVNIQDISNPTQIGYYNSPGKPKDLSLKDNLAYLADGNGGLRIVDISDLTNPVEVGSYETGDSFSKIDVSGDFAYVLYGAAGIHILDISNPLDIYEVSFAGISHTPVSILVQGNYAYVGDWISSHWGGQGHIWIFNISDPFNPIQIGEYDEGYTMWEDTFNPTDLALKDNYLYVADRIGYMVVLDVSDPTHPVRVSKTSAFAENIEIEGDFVYLSYSYGGVKIFDILDPLIPQEISTYDPTFSVRAIDVNYGEIYVSALDYGMMILHNEITTSVNDEIETLPNEFVLNQNYPNPFNPSTTISYSIPSSEYVTLEIYDILGSEIALLVNKEQTAGFYNVEFNATNFPSGIYIYTLQFGNRMTSKKMILLK
ncbi:MAG: T9SS type A sorting domain-containing protein [Bacteroidetes bacterium]|nr:T9SS type A sorting domain-containing protein [Bacteroidota bacterium]